jgi:hypothetical protein
VTDVFADQAQNDDITADILVGEGKKYKDVNELAKAYINADSHLDELRRDLAQARARSDAEKNQEPVVPPQQQQSDPTPAVPEKPQNTEDLRTLVGRELEALTESKRFEQNVETTAQTLIEHFGDAQKANQAVKEKARELGVSPDWLRDSAARSPKAFYATMGLNPEQQKRDTNTPAPRSEIRLESNNQNGKKNYAYFEQMRKNKDTRATYYSQSVQNEMHRLAKEQGDAFYA